MNYVYVAIHLRMPGLVKIGRTNNLKSRVSTLNTSLPEDFEIKVAFESDDEKLECIVKQRFAGVQCGAKKTKEFYKCSPQDVCNVIDNLVSSGLAHGRYLTALELAEAIRTTR